jgi:hypothetical protein
MSTICLKIDPGMHIGLHLIFFEKTGVTVLFSQNKSAPAISHQLNE